MVSYSERHKFLPFVIGHMIGSSGKRLPKAKLLVCFKYCLIQLTNLKRPFNLKRYIYVG